MEKELLKKVTEQDINHLKNFVKNSYLASTFTNYVFFGEKDEELPKLWKEMSDNYDFRINPKNMTRHKPEYNGIDLSKALSCISQETVFEHMMVIVLDDEKVVDYKVVDKGTQVQCGSYDCGKKIIEYLLQFVGPLNNYQIIFAHNHPSYICAIPSDVDKVQTMRLRILCKYFGFNEVDNIVVTPYDIYSQYQWDVANINTEKKNQCLIKRPSITKDQRAKINEISESLKYLNFGLF